MKGKKYILLIILVFPVVLFGQTEHIIQPNVADPLSGAPNNNHFVIQIRLLARKTNYFSSFLVQVPSLLIIEKY